MAGNITTFAAFRASFDPEDFKKGVEEMKTSIDGGVSALDKLEARFDQHQAAVNAYARAQAEVARQYDQGMIDSTEKQAQALATLDKAYAKTTESVNEHANSLKELMGLIGEFGVSLSVAGIVEFGKEIFNSAAELEDQAKQVGLSTEALQAYRNVMEEAGIRAGEADTLLKNLNRSIGEALDPTSKMAGIFRELGITAETLAGGSEAVMPLLAEALLSIDNTSLRASTSVQILRRSGQDLNSALEELKEPTQSLIDKGEAAGKILGENVTKGAHDARIELEGYWKVFTESATKAAVELIENTLTDIHNIAAGWNAAKAAVEGYWNYLRGNRIPPAPPAAAPQPTLAASGVRVTPENPGLLVYDQINVTPGVFDPLGRGTKSLKAIDDLTAYHKEEQAVRDEYDKKEAEAAQATDDKIAEINDEAAKKEAEAAQATDDKIAEINNESAKKDAEALQAFHDKRQELIDEADKKEAEAHQKMLDEWQKIGDRALNSMIDNLISGENAWQSLRNVALQALKDIAHELLKTMETSSSSGFSGFIAKLFGAGGGGAAAAAAGGGGGNLALITDDAGAAVFAGAFASGGTLQPGQWGIAGENGPEPIFAGNTPLTVFGQGMGGGTTVVINAPGANGDTVQMMRQIAAQIATQVTLAAAPHIATAANKSFANQMRNTGRG